MVTCLSWLQRATSYSCFPSPEQRNSADDLTLGLVASALFLRGSCFYFHQYSGSWGLDYSRPSHLHQQLSGYREKGPGNWMGFMPLPTIPCHWGHFLQSPAFPQSLSETLTGDLEAKHFLWTFWVWHLDTAALLKSVISPSLLQSVPVPWHFMELMHLLSRHSKGPSKVVVSNVIKLALFTEGMDGGWHISCSLSLHWTILMSWVSPDCNFLSDMNFMISGLDCIQVTGICAANAMLEFFSYFSPKIL